MPGDVLIPQQPLNGGTSNNLVSGMKCSTPNMNNNNVTGLQGNNKANNHGLAAVKSEIKTNGTEHLPGMKKKQPICVGCGMEIFDQFILRVSPNLEWHPSCLKCIECKQQLDENCTCFMREGKAYCKRDYLRLFGAKCAKCHETFQKTDYVMRARNRIYHLDCFHCAACGRPLQPGEEFALKEQNLFCRADFNLLDKVSPFSAAAASANDRLSLCLDSFRSPSPGSMLTPLDPAASRPLQLLLPRGQSPMSPLGPLMVNAPHSTASTTSQHSSGASSTSSGDGGGSSHCGEKHRSKKDQKTTRVRTVLNEKQLHTLRTCYNANPRPDALMKEQLVEMTGLSPRVIRVWFQNKRCKDKKKTILIKQLQQQQEKAQVINGIRMHQGIGPLRAGSPIRHDISLLQPIDISQFQQNPALWGGPLPGDFPGPPLHLAGPDAGMLDSQQQQTATPFQQLLHGFGDPNMDPTAPLGFLGMAPGGVISGGGPSVGELTSISPQLMNSDLSSPSCSD